MRDAVKCDRCRGPAEACKCGTFIEVLPDAPRFRFEVSATCLDCGEVFQLREDGIVTTRIFGPDGARIPIVTAGTPLECWSCHNIRPAS